MDLSHRSLNDVSRRAFLATTMLGALSAVTGIARAHSNAGVVVPPALPPTLSLTFDDGKVGTLAQVLKGRVSAVQLMFTSCSATCPIQGAVFAQAARELGDSVKDAQWLSLSIDPGRDTPQALHTWMGRFGAHPRWRAARPAPKQLDAVFDFLKARNTGPDRHTAQVYFFNRRGELTMRSVDFPPAAELTRVMRDLAKR